MNSPFTLLVMKRARGLLLYFNLSDGYKFHCNPQMYSDIVSIHVPQNHCPNLSLKGVFCTSQMIALWQTSSPTSLIEQIKMRLDQTLNQCARVAEEGYQYFAIHNYGECHSEGRNYTRHEKSAHCLNFANKLRYGVGKENSSFVYKILA